MSFNVTEGLRENRFPRRVFIARAGATAGVLVVALQVPGFSRFGAGLANAAENTGVFEANAWLSINAKGEFVFMLDRAEMGQGVMTALPMMFGEEFDVDPRRFKIENAPADRKYDNKDLNMQVTGGSTSVHAAWGPLRQAGADLRAIFVLAAAKKWGVTPNDCRTSNGVVFTGADSATKQIAYSELVDLAKKEKVKDAPLKNPAQYLYIGKDFPRLENRAKVTGAAGFGVDVRIENLVVATIIRPPQIDAKVTSFDGEAAKASAGVVGVILMPEGSGVAVLARSYWHSKEAAQKVKVVWSGGRSEISSEKIREQFEAALKRGTSKAEKRGNVENAVVNAPIILQETYELPYLAHATLEPQNCTAVVSKTKCEVWAPTQSPALAHAAAIEASGLKPSEVFIHTTMLGGGFGRRLAQDYVREAVLLAKISGKPVKVVWSREDDMQQSPYRPASLHKLRGAIDNQGKLVAWEHHMAGPSILAQLIPDWAPAMMPGWIPGFIKKSAGGIGSWAMKGRTIDDTAVEGAKDMPYAVDAFYMGHAHVDPGVPVGFWRSVGHSYTGFVVESFVDELAHKAGEDPVAFRRRLLLDKNREKAVMDLVAIKADWGKKLPKGTGMGIAQHASFRSYAAVVAEVVVEGKNIKVQKIFAAIDCGRVINPDMVRAQVEGAVIFGLSAALKGQITFKNGAVEQSNFHDYQILRNFETPQIEVHIIQSDADPTGVGEPGVPPVAPAVANAIFAASQNRLRKLPLEITV